MQIRDVPEETHRVLKARAALAGVSLSEYLREMLGRSAARPTPEEFAARIASREKVTSPIDSAALVRELRDHGE